MTTDFISLVEVKIESSGDRVDDFHFYKLSMSISVTSLHYIKIYCVKIIIFIKF